MSLKVHHLNCGSFCPSHAKSVLPTERLSCHCLLVETSEGLVLVDTGLPRNREGEKADEIATFVSRPQLPQGQSAREQVEALGYNASDVRNVIVTHLDYDHMGGARDFPDATLHCHAQETKSLKNPGLYKHRYRLDLWNEIKHVETYDRFGETWNGFKATRSLNGLPPEILLVPLTGHTLGHSGIAIDSNDGWILHAGDAFFFQEDLSSKLRDRNVASDVLQLALAMSNLQRLMTLRHLAGLKTHNPAVKLINSHDPRLLPSSLASGLSQTNHTSTS